MNKNIRSLITSILVISAFSAIVPGGILNFEVVEVQASTYKGAANGQLKSLYVYRSTGKELQLYSNVGLSRETELTINTDYYINLKGSDTIEIDAEVEGDDYVVKIFTSNDKDAKGYNPSEIGSIPIDSGSTKIYIRTYRSEDDYREAWANKNVKKCVKTYILHIYKDTVTSDEEDSVEYPYLRSIYLSDGNIDFLRRKTSYVVNVNEDVKNILVRAKPDDYDDLVEINGDSVDEDGDYEKEISLDKGKNIIEITVKNNDETTTYTLVINRGGLISESSDKNNESSDISTESDLILYNNRKSNVWIAENGNYMYIDGIGQPIKNKWWFDAVTGNDYYFDENGYAKTGWMQINKKWYYFNNSGKMQKGWINYNGKWYFLNTAGTMITGWYKDASGKWYYLNTDGSMKTGWLYDNENWYLLNSDGTMVTGLVLVDGVHYNFSQNGIML
ncbi:N-acetylmuramoyl-L-alanine amidase family protein [uncultured Clostridium sp.]|uniref:N-acetylmuramoyl-L-alanine amidase family protein n=1 Tax=uncultured Clostridium sp. TaxID=59620 RepID=UPI0025DCC3D4|nr:cadherin-like beta sandwich domain-containing protein [uncultured Clostridium sp.]